MATIAGLFRNQSDVDCAVRALNENGYGKNSISIAAPESQKTLSDSQSGDYITLTGVDQAGAGILITVVAEEGHHTEVRDLLQGCRAVDIDMRYGMWDRGDLKDYEEITDESREERSSNG